MLNPTQRLIVTEVHAETSAPAHITALDGLRGAAFLMVFIFHGYGRLVGAGPVSTLLVKVASYGWIGVDLFFVLSGYLITEILIRSRTADHYYRNFYARRALRIFPVYYLAVAAVFLVQPFVSSQLGTGDSTRCPWPVQIWYWLNLSNLISAFEPGRVYYLVHFWSLALEEQFYLVWPAVVRRASQKTLLRVLGLALIAGEFGRNLPLVIHSTERYHDFTYRLTPLHADGLICGAMLAIILGRRTEVKSTLRLPFALTSALVGLVFFLFSRFAGEAVWAIFAVRWFSLVTALFFASLLGFLLSHDKEFWLARWLSNPALRWIGMLSYCLYVVHILGLKIGSKMAARIPGLSIEGQNLMAPLIALVLCVGVAMFSRAYIEGPALRLKRYFPQTSLSVRSAMR